MADFTAYYSINQQTLNLNSILDGAWGSGFSDDVLLEIRGEVYEDVFTVAWDNAGSSFFGVVGGAGFSASNTEIFAGVATGYHEYLWDGEKWLEVYSITNASFSARDWYSAVISEETSDDIALYTEILSANDTINLSSGADIAYGVDGDDRIDGFGGDDRIFGGSGDDWIVGGAGNDTLLGEAGDDVLIGGLGDDRLTGGAGADTFVFALGDDTMTIVDFEPGIDDLALVGLRAGFTVLDLLPFVSQDGGDVVIRAGSQEVRFADTQLSDLSAGDVVFV